MSKPPVAGTAFEAPVPPHIAVLLLVAGGGGPADV